MYKERKLPAFLIALLMLISALGANGINASAVKVSNTNYNVYLNGLNTYICNKIPGKSEIGTEYFMTYTVKEVSKMPDQHALVGTDDVKQDWPYENGGLFRGSNEAKHLLDVGYTYFIRFTAAEGGFHYNITRAKGDVEENLYLEDYYGDGTDKWKYFGLWFGATPINAELTNVRCYDKDGKDLGVQILQNKGSAVNASLRLKKDTEVDHAYDIRVTDQFNIAIGNIRKPTSSKVYMEYEVESAEYLLNQEGIGLSDVLSGETPHITGMLKLDSYENGSDKVQLLEVGASYIISMDRTEDGFDVVVQKTKDGKTAVYTFKEWYGPNFNKESTFYYLWFGYEGTHKATFHLKNFKLYDGNKNNLGVQCNKKATIQHFGEVEDYAGCEAIYYCKENTNLFALYQDQTLKHTVQKQTEDATYVVSKNILTAKYEDRTEEYEYLFKRITDQEEKVYDRLYTYKVSFDTGTEEMIESQTLSQKNGYLVMKPTSPIKEGKEFEGWYTEDGKQFDFEQIVTKSTTLYAKYEGEEIQVEESNVAMVSVIVMIAFAIVLAGIVILLVKRGKKYGSH